MTIPPADGDQRRLDALDSYDILDSAIEQDFEDIVLLARQVCDTPIALVSLVAANRQWFKAVEGLDISETPISQSVCAHALQQPGTMVIPDLTRDPRTSDNTLVTEAPFIRFYAGAILTSASGVPIGTVCVIDTKPRPHGLTPDQIAGLEALARQVMVLMNMRRALILGESTVSEQRAANFQSTARALESERLTELLKLNEARLRMAQEAGKIGSFEIDMLTDEMTVTDQFCRIYGLSPRRNIAAVEIERLVHPDDAAVISNREQRKEGTTPLFAEYRIRKADTGQTIWISRRAQFMYDLDDKPIRMLGTVHDVTERKEIEDRQALLNQELGHRLKNTLALVQAIAAQTLRGASDKDAVRAFEQRVNALSRAHDVLLQQSWTGANMREIMIGVLGLHGDIGRFRLDGPEINLGSKAALSLSLLLHELATNAIKYGALSVPDGHIDVTWRRDDLALTLLWSERGGPSATAPLAVGLGTRLINMGLVGTGGATKRYGASGFEVEFRTPLAAVEEA